MSDNLNLSEMSYEDRRRYQHINTVHALRTLLEVSHVPLLRYEGSRVARITVVLDPPGKKNFKSIDFAPYLPAYIDREGNVSCKEEEDNA